MNTCIRRVARPALLMVVALLGVALATPIGAAPPTAEEMVALMLWGQEQGARTKHVSEDRWEVEGHDGDRSSFGITRLTDCLFRVSGHVRRAGMHDVLEFDYILNFAAVHDYSAWRANGRDQRIIVKVEGRSWYSKTVRSKATGRTVYSISGGNIDTYVADGGSIERLQSTFAYFQSVFCRDRG